MQYGCTGEKQTRDGGKTRLDSFKLLRAISADGKEIKGTSPNLSSVKTGEGAELKGEGGGGGMDQIALAPGE